MTIKAACKLAGSLGLSFALLAAAAPPASAQHARRGVPSRGVAVRAPARVLPSRVVRVSPFVVSPYRYGRYFGPRFGVAFGYGYPYYGYGLGYGWLGVGYPYFSPFYGSYAYGYGYPAYGYGYGYPAYGYPAYGYGGGYIGAYGYAREEGSVRIVDAPKEAQVFVDGYYAGIADDFDGAFQHLNLTPGAHTIEVRAPGLETNTFQVNAQPGQSITFHARMRATQQ